MDKKNLLKRFGKNVKIARINKDLTQEQLSEIMDISINYLSEIERGKHNMSLGKILELANYLGVDISVLLNFKDNQ